MVLELFLDLAQTGKNGLAIRDISDADLFVDEFPSSGKASVYGYYISFEHSDDAYPRYYIKPCSGSEDFPTVDLSLQNESFKKMNPAVNGSGYVYLEQSSEVLSPILKDGIYRIGYGVGKNPGSSNMAANKTYYLINATSGAHITVTGGFVQNVTDNSIFLTATTAVATNIDFFETAVLSNGQKAEANFICMLSAQMLKDYADALIKFDGMRNPNTQEQMESLLSKFRTRYDRTKALVMVDDYTNAVFSFADCKELLNQILNIA